MASGRMTAYFVLRSIGWLVDNLLVFGIPLLCYRVTGGLAWSGLAVVLTWTPRLLSLAGAGYLVDRLSIRQVFAVADAGRLVLAVVCCLLILLRPGTAVPVVLVFGMLSGAFFEQTFVAGEKAGQLLVRPERTARTQSVLTGLEQSAIIAGPALGGLLLLFPPVVFVATAGAGYAVSLLLVRTLPAGRADPDAAPSPLAGLRRTVRDPVLRRVVLLTMGLNYLLSLLIGSAPALVATRYGVSESTLGFVYSAAGVASVAVVGFAPWLIGRLGLWRYGIGLALASALVCLGLSAAPDLALFGTALGVFLALDSLFSVYLRTTRAERVPTAEYGSAVAAFGLLLVAPMPVAGATLALAGSSVDPAVLLRVAALGALVLTLALLPGLARADRPGRSDRPDRPDRPDNTPSLRHAAAPVAAVAHEPEDTAR